MPKVELSVKTKDGQTILLSPEDRIEKTVTIECNSGRCASRHGQDNPLEVAVVEGELIPEVGDQWMSIILPERSPQYAPMPMNFCSAQCARDFLIYDYIAPGPRKSPEASPEIVEQVRAAYLRDEAKGTVSEQANYQGVKVESFSHPVIEAVGKTPAIDEDYFSPVSQADGDPADVHGA